ncbi:alcohol dehydrogenase [Anaeromyxobacter diazotrophicus]|uniref:Alcohol dehydrogenase n=1 Tax=Anaeromyxobacter diazotrophicus TaxID=2590199 RepID=A0A7I9VMT4_9BACT|nr:alcohol dehydrogenase [Anaeromyxobacter diazotrophicus]
MAAGGDWPTYNGSYAGDRFSPLAEITSANVSGLKPICTFDTGDKGAFQVGPVVVGGVMYLTTDTETFAIDAATCAQRWKHVHEYQPRSWLGNNHGVAYLDGRLFRGSGDGHFYALDAATGRALWEVVVADTKAGESLPMAPIAWNGMVFVGNAGGDNFGVTGHVNALSVEDGHTLWRMNVVPEAGPVRATWTKESPTNPPTGGGTWTSYSLDTAAGLLYVPTGNVAPDFVGALHPGPSLYATSVLAVDARTGFVAGYVQPVKSDSHDHDVASPPALVTTRGGKQMALTAAKDGLLYGIERSGVRREDAVATDAAIAPETLVVRYRSPTTTRDNLDEPLTTDRYVRFCPGSQGGTEWNGPAFDPGSNTVLVAATDWCTSVKLSDPATLVGKTGGAWTGVTDQKEAFGKQDAQWGGGWLSAFDADTGELRWKYHASAPILAAVTVTAGGLVLTGDLDGNSIAFEAATGKELWKGTVGQPAAAGVVSYSAGGRQLIAVGGGAASPLWPLKSDTSRIVVFGLR